MKVTENTFERLVIKIDSAVGPLLGYGTLAVGLFVAINGAVTVSIAGLAGLGLMLLGWKLIVRYGTNYLVFDRQTNVVEFIKTNAFGAERDRTSVQLDKVDAAELCYASSDDTQPQLRLLMNSGDSHFLGYHSAFVGRTNRVDRVINQWMGRDRHLPASLAT